MKKKLILIVSIMSLFLSGCNPVLSMKNTAGDLKEKISSEIAESQKRLDSRLNKKISTLNTAISEKDEEIIYDLMADDLKNAAALSRL